MLLILQDLNLYAEFAGKTIPTSKHTESNNKYQVSKNMKNIPEQHCFVRDKNNYKYFARFVKKVFLCLG